MPKQDRPELYMRYFNSVVTLHPYHSGAIHSAGYDPNTQVFFVRLHADETKLKVYFDVQPEVWEEFQFSAIKFRFYNTYIDGMYPMIIAPLLPEFHGSAMPPTGEPPSQS